MQMQNVRAGVRHHIYLVEVSGAGKYRPGPKPGPDSTMDTSSVEGLLTLGMPYVHVRESVPPVLTEHVDVGAGVGVGLGLGLGLLGLGLGLGEGFGLGLGEGLGLGITASTKQSTS